MLNEITIRFSGEQGSGVQSTGQIAASYLTKLGYDVFAVNDFESRIIGGYSFVQLRIGISEGYSINLSADLCFPFSKSSAEQDIKTLSSDSQIFLTKDSFLEELNKCKFNIINTDTILEPKELKFKNTFFLGILSGLLNTDFEIMKTMLSDRFRSKGQETMERNVTIAEKAFNYVSELKLNSFNIEKPSNIEQNTKAVNGSFAISQGAAMSNCKFYCAYPMSPSTSVINNLSDMSKDYSIVTEQAEDEIAAITVALGASYAGVRSMTGTSGGGLALMDETISMAAIAEVPLVILDAQRPGPATGLPTRTEQGDLLFSLFLGHGEFTKVIIAPGTHDKAFELTQKAFYLADKYQIPVIILTDQYIMDSIKSCKKWELNENFNNRFIEIEDDNSTSEYLRYKFTETGVSPRKIPGFTKHAVIADSHTHTESGHITEDKTLRKKGVEKLLLKKEEILKELEKPYISADSLKDTIVIGWGSTFGAIKDAVSDLKKKGHSICHVHFHEVYPLSVGFLKQTDKKIICVENNATGQFATLLKMEGDLKIDEKILKYDGRPFYRDELIAELEKKM